MTKQRADDAALHKRMDGSMDTCIAGRTEEESDIWKDIFSAIHYGLEGPEFESQWGEAAALVVARPGAHPASYSVGIGSFPEVKRGSGHGINHPPRSSAEVKCRTHSSTYKTAYIDACKTYVLRVYHNCTNNRISEKVPSGSKHVEDIKN
jgi:hypothetical protein